MKPLKDFDSIKSDNDTIMVTFRGNTISDFHMVILRSRYIGSISRYLYEHRGVRTNSVQLREFNTDIILVPNKKINEYCKNEHIFHIYVDICPDLLASYTNYPPIGILSETNSKIGKNNSKIDLKKNGNLFKGMGFCMRGDKYNKNDNVDYSKLCDGCDGDCDKCRGSLTDNTGNIVDKAKIGNKNMYHVKNGIYNHLVKVIDDVDGKKKTGLKNPLHFSESFSGRQFNNVDNSMFVGNDNGKEMRVNKSFNGFENIKKKMSN